MSFFCYRNLSEIIVKLNTMIESGSGIARHSSSRSCFLTAPILVEEVVNRKLWSRCAWERLRRIMAMGAMYIEGIRATTNPNKPDKNNNVVDY